MPQSQQPETLSAPRTKQSTALRGRLGAGTTMMLQTKERASAKSGSRFSPELERACSEYLEHSVEFATKFATLAEVAPDLARELKGEILARCSDVIAKARLHVLEIHGR